MSIYETMGGFLSVFLPLATLIFFGIIYRYGSYNDFRRSAFGSLTIRNDGIELEKRYTELANAYPEIFDIDVDDVDQPALLLEAYRGIKDG